MGVFDGIGLNPISLLSTAAFGPMGGFMSQIISRFGQQLIQQMGRQANLPQSTIEMAQARFTASHGDLQGTSKNLNQAIEAFGKEQRAGLTEIAHHQREMQKTLDRVVRDMSESQDFKDAKASHGKGKGGAGAAHGKGGGGGESSSRTSSVGDAPGWLMAMAKVLGKKLDDLADDMENRAKNISESDPSSSAEFGVVSQQFGMLMNAVNNSLKTIGDALGKMADKH